MIDACLATVLWQETSRLVGALDICLDGQDNGGECQIYLDINLNINRKEGDRWGEAWCLSKLGFFFEKRGENRQAIAYYKQSLPIWREIEHKDEESNILCNIAATCNNQGKYEQALQYYKQSLTIKREFCDQKRKDYKAWDDYAPLLQYLEQDLTITREGGGERIILNNIASTYRAEGNIAKALE